MIKWFMSLFDCKDCIILEKELQGRSKEVSRLSREKNALIAKVSWLEDKIDKLKQDKQKLNTKITTMQQRKKRAGS